MTARLTVRLCMISATIILLAGCAITSRQSGSGLNRNASFMDAWHTYSHCVASKEPEAILTAVEAQNRFKESTD